MKEWKSNLLMIYMFISSFTNGEEIIEGESVVVDNVNNPQLYEKSALKSSDYEPGEELINNGEILVNGTHPSDNSNLAGIRGNNTIVINNGDINIASYSGGYGIIADGNSQVNNTGTVFIKGSKNIGILGRGNTTINNTGRIEIDQNSLDVIGILSEGGSSSNNGEIFVKGNRSGGMKASGDATQINIRKIVIEGDNSYGMEGSDDSTSVNIGEIVSNAYQGKGLISYEGSQLENKGTIVMEGYRNYGIISKNQIDKNSTQYRILNEGILTIKGDYGVGITGIKIDGIENSGTILIEGNFGTGIIYTHVNDIKNSGEVILKGYDNWGFAVDEVIDNEVKSIGKVSIKDSTNSGVFRVKGSVLKGINEGSVWVTDSIGTTVIKVENNGEAINRGIIDIAGGNSNYGIHSKNGKRIVNSNIIRMNDSGGIAIYNPNGDYIQNTGTIILAGRNQAGIYYENENTGIINTGEIVVSGNGNIAFEVSTEKNKIVKSVGNVLIDKDAIGGIAAYARLSIKEAVNDGTIKIEGVNSAGLVGLDETTLINNGNINVNNVDSYGIQAVNDATVINRGNVSNTAKNGVAIYMGVEESNIYMDNESTIIGDVYSAGGVGTFHGTNENESEDVHKIGYDIVNFSHLNLKNGNFEIIRDNVLIAPQKNVLLKDHSNTEDYTGSLFIKGMSVLVMEVGVNARLTSTIHADSLKIEGNLKYKPLDQVYITEKDVVKIINIYTNNEIEGVTDENIEVIDVISGWSGSYELSEDGSDMSLVLTRSEDGMYLPPSYYDSVYYYPHTFLDVKYIDDMVSLSDNFKVFEKVHNEEIPHYIDFKVMGAIGSYKNKARGGFDFNNYGMNLRFNNKIKENMVYGFGFSNINTDIKYPTSDEKMTTYMVDTNLVYKFNEIKIGGYIAVSQNEHDLTRGVTGYDIKLKSQYNSNVYKAGIGAEYEYRMNKNTIYTSYADIGLTYLDVESYRENGNEFYTMNIDGAEKLIPIIKIGVNREKRNRNGYTNLGVRINYYIDENLEERSSYFLFKPNVKYDITPVDVPGFTITLDAGQTVDITDRFSIYALGAVNIGENFQELNGKVGFTYEF